jgi:hypothetical protein
MYDKVKDTKGVIRSLKLKHTMDNRKLTREQTFIKKEKKRDTPKNINIKQHDPTTTGETLGYPGE